MFEWKSALPLGHKKWQALKTKDVNGKLFQCIRKWGLQCAVIMEQSAWVYLTVFKHPLQYETLLLFQMCVWLSRCGADTAWCYQPNGHWLPGWPVMRLWLIRGWFAVFCRRVCWDQVQLNKLVKCLPFSSGLFVSAGDRDNTGNVFGASVSRLLGNYSIRNSANCLMSSLTLKSATAFTVEGKIRQVMSLLYSFLKYRYVTGGKGEINSLVLTSNTILNVVVSLMQFIK